MGGGGGEEEYTEEIQRSMPAFHHNSATAHGVHNQNNKALHVLRRGRRRRREAKEAKIEEEKTEEGEETEDREEVERKIEALQRIVPGGELLGVDKLFDETAGYIVALQYQVKALRALTSFFEKLEKEKNTKFGG